MNSLVSLIITTKNEEKILAKLLQSIKRQEYKNIETILVDNNSIDDTVKIAKKMAIKIFNFGPERSAQRNFGAKKAKGKFVFVLDADMQLTSNVIGECIEIMNNNKKMVALIIPEKSHAFSFWEKVKAYERSFYNLEGDSLTDAARFFKKEIFLKIKGYDETITGPEDWDLTERIIKAGYRIGRTKNFIYHKETIVSLFDLARKKFYYALKAHRYLDKHRLPLIGPKTIYFLRPVFLKSAHKLFASPILFFGMLILLSVEFIAGGFGYIIGRIENK